MEENSLYSELNFQTTPDRSPNCVLAKTGPTQKNIQTYQCPSTMRMMSTRSGFVIADCIPTGQVGSFYADGDGMGIIDYGGIEGPDNSMLNPLTKTLFPENDGVLLKIDTAVSPSANGIYTAQQVRIRDITDGTSKTIAVAELTGRGYNAVKLQIRGAWADGYNTMNIQLPVNSEQPNMYTVMPAANPQTQNNGTTTPWGSDEIRSDHPGGAQAVMCDGSVQFFTDDMAVAVLWALTTRNGNDPIPQGVLVTN
jgi:prepilin-type processing-associated H-X9-DG protein